MNGTILQLSEFSRKDVSSSHAEWHLDGFCKAILLVKSLLKSSGAEIIVAVNNMLAAGILSADEVRVLGKLYGWELGQ